MFEGAFESTDCFLKRERYIVYNEAIEIKKNTINCCKYFDCAPKKNDSTYRLKI